MNYEQMTREELIAELTRSRALVQHHRGDEKLIVRAYLEEKGIDPRLVLQGKGRMVPNSRGELQVDQRTISAQTWADRYGAIADVFGVPGEGVSDPAYSNSRLFSRRFLDQHFDMVEQDIDRIVKQFQRGVRWELADFRKKLEDM